MAAAFDDKMTMVNGLPGSLLALLGKGGAESHAAAWALVWLSGGFIVGRKAPIWTPSDPDLDVVITSLIGAPKAESSVRRFLVNILGSTPGRKGVPAIVSQFDGADELLRESLVEALVHMDDKEAVAPLLGRLNDPDKGVRCSVITILGQLGDKQAVAPLLAKVEEPDEDVVAAAAEALYKLDSPEAGGILERLLQSPAQQLRRTALRMRAKRRDKPDRRLLSKDLDDMPPWLDPHVPITEDRVARAATAVGLAPDEVRSRYEALADEFKLKLAWRVS